jgi:hypothetical protein
MEPNPEFLVLLTNEESEVGVTLNTGDPHRGGFNKGLRLNNGQVTNAIAIAPLGGAITPQRPMKIRLTAKNGAKPIGLVGVLHRTSTDVYDPVPHKQ